MKSFLLTTTAAILGFCASISVQAGDCKGPLCVNSIPKTHSKGCKVKVCTKVIDRCTVTKTATDVCGKKYTYTVTCITYKDVYCDGTTRIWKSTI